MAPGFRTFPVTKGLTISAIREKKAVGDKDFFKDCADAILALWTETPK